MQIVAVTRLQEVNRKATGCQFGLLLVAAALSLMPSGLLVSRMLVSRVRVQPKASRGPAPGVSPEPIPTAELPPAAVSEAGEPYASERVAFPQLQIAPATINVAMATDEDQPIGLLAVINSTLSHGTSPDFRFHLIVPVGQRKPLRLALVSLFGQASFRMYSLDAGGVRSKIQHHLKRRDKDPVYVSPFRALLWPICPSYCPPSSEPSGSIRMC